MKVFAARYARFLFAVPALALLAVAAAHGFDAHIHLAGCEWDDGACPTVVHQFLR